MADVPPGFKTDQRGWVVGLDLGSAAGQKMAIDQGTYSRNPRPLSTGGSGKEGRLGVLEYGAILVSGAFQASIYLGIAIVFVPFVVVMAYVFAIVATVMVPFAPFSRDMRNEFTPDSARGIRAGICVFAMCAAIAVVMWLLAFGLEWLGNMVWDRVVASAKCCI